MFIVECSWWNVDEIGSCQYKKVIFKYLAFFQDMSMCCQLEGYKQEQLAFIDSLLKELGIQVLY